MGRWYLPLSASLLLLCCGGGAAEPTPAVDPTATEPPATATNTQAPPTPTATPTLVPFVAFVTQGAGGNVVQRIAVEDLEGVPEELPHRFPFTDVALSPGGGFAAYSPPSTAPTDIILVDLATFEERNISNSPADDEVFPFWSADGALVGAVLANADGLAIRWQNLASGNGDVSEIGDVEGADLRWLPEGAGFSFVDDGAFATFAFDGGYSRYYENEAWQVLEGVVAPDGERAAVIQVQERETEPATVAEWRLSIVAETGLVVATVAPGFENLANLQWDYVAGTDLLTFTGANLDGRTGLWVTAPGRSPRLIYEGRVEEATWSADGAMVAVVADGGECSARTCPRGYLRVVEVDSSRVYRWDSSRVLGKPAWGP